MKQRTKINGVKKVFQGRKKLPEQKTEAIFQIAVLKPVTKKSKAIFQIASNQKVSKAIF